MTDTVDITCGVLEQPMRTAILHTNTGIISDLHGRHGKKETPLEIQTSIKVKLS